MPSDRDPRSTTSETTPSAGISTCTGSGRGIGTDPSTHCGFTTLKPIPLQLDGEVLALDAGTQVQVDIAPGVLATIG